MILMVKHIETSGVNGFPPGGTVNVSVGGISTLTTYTGSFPGGWTNQTVVTSVM